MMNRALMAGVLAAGLAFSGSAFAQSTAGTMATTNGTGMGTSTQTRSIRAQHRANVRGLTRSEINRNSRNRRAAQRSINRSNTDTINGQTRGIPQGSMGTGTGTTGVGATTAR